MKRLFALMFVVAVALAGLVAPRAEADEASQKANVADIAAMVDAHNAIRVSKGHTPLRFVPKVAAAIAQDWAISMRKAGKISHNDDFRWDGAEAWGENVGWNVGYTNPVQTMMDDWMASDSHRANILEASYTHIAVGLVRSESEIFAAVNFYKEPLIDAGTAYDSGTQWLTAVQQNITAVNPAKADDVYSKTGTYAYNNRLWKVACEPYSQTQRCRTDIWATVISYKSGNYQRSTGWAFNNLTYQPSARSLWAGNPLATKGDHVISGRKWRTDCDSAATGRNGCRSYIQTPVVTATAKAGGGYTFTSKVDYVFNNIVRFK
ncbi:CAP domain-containing protein [Tessaracoccus sp. MC1865]|uniref:CAP domain-containing protein n=1 Tax=Tessaracoccus sp. MC1865 TaxID=2760310 RepID=UPI0016019CA6|nr:CAP domain-containing protein [Tessaracoccus sp. MC1865]MBB1484159.1 CAP domain-containing protein [Tessaracoccus sp. MC1865]QTO37184.1 CAP domain-containing protein [Tessaracoccus sp. MC1865]